MYRFDLSSSKQIQAKNKRNYLVLIGLYKICRWAKNYLFNFLLNDKKELMSDNQLIGI
nr:hypothetical protein [Mycoplasmopsis bovis]